MTCNICKKNSTSCGVNTFDANPIKNERFIANKNININISSYLVDKFLFLF